MRTEARAGRIALVGISAAIAAIPGFPPERRETTALYLLVTYCNLTGAVAAEALGCSRQNVSQVLGRVEDRRDDPQFNVALEQLEAQFMERV